MCSGPEEFVIHCKSNTKHKNMEQKFQSTDFDYLFASDLKTDPNSDEPAKPLDSIK